jgi:hypothetical protein
LKMKPKKLGVGRLRILRDRHQHRCWLACQFVAEARSNSSVGVPMKEDL